MKHKSLSQSFQRNEIPRAREVAQWIRVLTALLEDQDLISINLMATNNHL